jgi:Domain of unknown function (DUF4328)/Protein of unknown function (DUF2510)
MAAETQTALPPQGWYQDPEGPAGQERYWDGGRWTEHRRSQPPPSPVTQPRVAEKPQALSDVSWLALIMLGVTAVVFVWLMVAGINYENKLSNFAGSSGFGVVFSATQLIDARDAAKTALTVSTIIQLVASVAFLPWFHRAYRNLARIGADLRYTTGWAIGAWFIPIFSWWRPKQIANDIWRGSSLDQGLQDPQWHARPVSSLVHWWWASYLGWGLLNTIGWTVAGGNSDLTASGAIDTEKTGIGFIIAASIVGIVGIVLAVLMVRRITQNQDAVLGSTPGSLAATPTPSGQPAPAPGNAVAAAAPSPGAIAEAAESRPGRFCSNCGTALSQGGRFCSSCGAEVSG